MTAVTPIWFRAVFSLVLVGALFFSLMKMEADGATYLWVKAVHVISIICWMAGMLYLPRLFIYHCGVEQDSPQDKTFKVMERRLLHIIINPAMIVAWITGLWLAAKIYAFHGGWLHLKLAAVLVLSAFYGLLSRAVRHFAAGHNRFSQKTWRILNEVPTLLMIIIVIAVIVKIP